MIHPCTHKGRFRSPRSSLLPSPLTFPPLSPNFMSTKAADSAPRHQKRSPFPILRLPIEKKNPRAPNKFTMITTTMEPGRRSGSTSNYNGFRNNLFHGSCFTPSQLQELHNQAIIFNFMSLGLPIPPHLLLCLRRGGFFPHQSPLDWGCLRLRSNGREEDPEPGRCRRTDGKKWRCSRVACPDSKYCERHLHRGKNRLRKHTESSVLHTITAASSPSSPLSLLPPENQRKRAAHEDLRYCHGANDNGGEQASSSATSGLSFQHCFVMGKDLSLERSSEPDNPISLHCFFDDRPKDERRDEELPGSASSFSLFDLNV